MTDDPQADPLTDLQLDEYEALATNATLLGANIASPGILAVLVAEVRRLRAVPFAPADRAAVLREAADAVAADTEIHIRYGSATDYANRHADLLRRMAVEAQQPETRQSCACGQDGCEYCDVDDGADETQQSESATTWTPGPVAVARAAEWAGQRRAATVDPAMCPRCKGDNTVHCPGTPQPG